MKDQGRGIRDSLFISYPSSLILPSSLAFQHFRRSQLDRTLAAFAFLQLEHRDRTNFAPIVQFILRAIAMLKDSDHLYEGDACMLANRQLELRVAQTRIAAEPPAAYVLDQGMKFARFRFKR